MAVTEISQLTELSFSRHPKEIALFKFREHSKTCPTLRSQIITIPPGSIWETGLHWHEEYVEYLQVLKGEARIHTDGVTKTYSPDDGVIMVPKFTIHGFGRGDQGRHGGDEADTVIEEWVNPDNGFKVVFFYNILGSLIRYQGRLGFLNSFRLAVVLAYMDEYPVVIGGPFVLKYVVIHTALSIVSWLGWAFRMRSWFKELTPKHLWSIAESRGAKRSSE